MAYETYLEGFRSEGLNCSFDRDYLMAQLMPTSRWMYLGKPTMEFDEY